jgi:superfamily II DNA or RNA helicase
LREAKGGYSDNSAFHFDIKPFAHQREILEQLDVERTVHQRYKNLVVAATGTGKTLISAFDFARFYKQHPEANFLFVAHRQEILKQALSAYRGVLKNNQFGELWVAEHKPNSYRHLFASIQSLNLQLSSLPLTADFYDYIVIDEVHHIAASSYRGLLEHFSPHILFGLTATPDRHDGQNILDDFCGVIAAEIRLPEAINQCYLCPFQYFAIDDETDLRNIKWHQGRYDIAELSHLYTHNEQRVTRIIRSLNDTVTDVRQIRALAFCVSKQHAEYMASKFNLAGISADVLTSDNSHERQRKRQSLISGDMQILCVVDIFNEGVDIPEVDTLLFLRPTESLTIFLQQLGRGLRLTDEKQCCCIFSCIAIT